ncbi:hypothetical protein D3C78_1718250 [compost metagenome]
MIEIQSVAELLALNEDLDGAVLTDGVVDLLPFLGSNVCGELGHHLGWIEHVVAEHSLNERHDECRLGCLFRLDHRRLLLDLGG